VSLRCVCHVCAGLGRRGQRVVWPPAAETGAKLALRRTPPGCESRSRRASPDDPLHRPCLARSHTYTRIRIRIRQVHTHGEGLARLPRSASLSPAALPLPSARHVGPATPRVAASIRRCHHLNSSSPPTTSRPYPPPYPPPAQLRLPRPRRPRHSRPAPSPPIPAPSKATAHSAPDTA